MADVKISALNALGTSPAADDLIPVVDVTATETKKLRIDELFTNPDVTGTVTADGLTVDGDGSLVTSSGAVLKLENSTTTMTAGDVIGELQFYANDGSTNGTGAKVNIKATTTSVAGSITDLTLGTSDSTSATALPRLNIAGNGDVSLFEDTGTTAKFFWDASAESLGIGTSSPSSYSGHNLVISDPLSPSIGFIDNSVNTANIAVDGNSLLLVTENLASTTIRFNPAGTERMRLDKDGDLLIGKTVANLGTTGIQLRPDGSSAFTRDSDITLYLGRNTTDGAIATFQKDGSTVGSIGVAFSDRFYFMGAGEGIAIDNSGNTLVPVTTTGAFSDAAMSLGQPAARYTDLYLSGGVYLGGIGAANLLDDYEQGTWTVTLTDASSNTSSTTVTGQYTKVGNKVTASFYTMLNIDTTGMVSGDALFITLPFTSGGAGAAVGSLVHNGIDTGSRTQTNIRVANSTNKALIQTSGSTINSGTVSVADVSSGVDDITFATITYFTA